MEVIGRVLYDWELNPWYRQQHGDLRVYVRDHQVRMARVLMTHADVMSYIGADLVRFDKISDGALIKQFYGEIINVVTADSYPVPHVGYWVVQDEDGEIFVIPGSNLIRPIRLPS